ncbi:MAG: hypothetical protein GXY47_00230 [Acidobacteria bacterium]|nr:hypothetical protein [Acidobacteriota bacterium]
MRFLRAICWILLIGLPAGAQQTVNIMPGYVSFARGGASLDGILLVYDLGRAQYVREGQRLVTGDGRAEIQLGLWATLWIGERAEVRFERLGHDRASLRVERGRAWLEIVDGDEPPVLELHFGDASAETREPGLYLLEGDPFRLGVYAGRAEVRRGGKTKKVKAGKAADFVRGIGVYRFDREKKDALRVWVDYRSHLLYGRIKLARAERLLRQRLENQKAQNAREALSRSAAARQIYIPVPPPPTPPPPEIHVPPPVK